MKNLLRYFIVLFLIFTLPVSSEINDKDELRDFLIKNDIKFINTDGYYRNFSFNQNGTGTFYTDNNKKEYPLIWEVVNKNTLRYGKPGIEEQKVWTNLKIDFKKKKIYISSKNGQKLTFDITFTNLNTSKTEETKSADSSFTYLSENEKDFPWCLGWITEKVRVEGQHKLTDMNRKLLQKPISKKILDILRSYMGTGGNWKKINDTFHSNLKYEYQHGRGTHIAYHRTYTGTTLAAYKSIAELKCIVIE